jgi:hypothetical protein
MERVLDLGFDLSGGMDKPAEADKLASWLALQSEHSVAAGAIVVLGDLHPLLTAFPREWRSVIDPAHHLGILIDGE